MNNQSTTKISDAFSLQDDDLETVSGGLAVNVLEYSEDWIDYICPRCGSFLDIPIGASPVGYTHKCNTCGLKYDVPTDTIVSAP